MNHRAPQSTSTPCTTERPATRIEYLFPLRCAGSGLRRSWAANHRLHPRPPPPSSARLLTDDGPVDGTVVGQPGRARNDVGPSRRPGRRGTLTATGECTWLDLTDLGLDRFDADGNSRVAPEPISLPFPEKSDPMSTSILTPFISGGSPTVPNWRTGVRSTKPPGAEMATHGIQLWGGR